MDHSHSSAARCSLAARSPSAALSGIIAAVLDEIMVWAGFVRMGRFAFCAEIRVRFVKPVRPGDDTVATGALVADRRGRIFELRADLRNPAGDVLASVEGKYLPIDQTEVSGMMDDIVEGPG